MNIWWDAVLVVAAWVVLMLVPILFTGFGSRARDEGDAEAELRMAVAEFNEDREKRGLL